MVDEQGRRLKDLLKDLDISLEDVESGARSLSSDLNNVFKLPVELFKRLALDIAIFCGVSGDWSFSHEIVNRLLAVGDDRLVVKLWQLRSLVELERFAEAIATASSISWPSGLLHHANYLAGMAYENLGMREQALQRYRAVAKTDASYREVAEKCTNS